MTARRRVGGVGIAVALGLMAFATQTADEVQDPVPHKISIAHWLETSLWIQPWFMLAGATLLLGATLVWWTGWRRRRLLPSLVVLVMPLVTLAVSVWIVLAAVNDWHVNLTASAPQ
jgi:hypothetical protein